jgi:hypothetical protein
MKRRRRRKRARRRRGRRTATRRVRHGTRQERRDRAIQFRAGRFDAASDVGKVDTRVAVLNLFDRVYQLRDGSGIGVGAPQFGPRRPLYVTVRKTFSRSVR